MNGWAAIHEDGFSFLDLYVKLAYRSVRHWCACGMVAAKLK